MYKGQSGKAVHKKDYDKRGNEDPYYTATGYKNNIPYAVDVGTNPFAQTNIINDFQFVLLLVC